MAKISERDMGRRDGGYTRIFDNEDLGALLSEVHATSISAGSELEKMVFINNVDDFDHFIENIPTVSGVYIASKPTIKRSTRYRSPKNEPDGIIFVIDQHTRRCNIIELKDGDTFDTKKVDGELESLRAFQMHISPQIQFIVDYFICGFNSRTIDDLYTGLKGRVGRNHLMTGRELCRLIQIDYDAIVEQRRADAAENMEYFINKLLDIEDIRDRIKRRLEEIEAEETDEDIQK